MENIPPSYEFAVARNPWSIIAPYIPSAELCALNRVNSELHHVFAPYLWGNPASHFGTENDRVYVALTRFRRTLKRVRLSVRQLTHTLHLPAAQSEIYDGPRPEWLREILEQLPNLKSLVVSRLPFFDHMALLALRSPKREASSSTNDENVGTFPLRLLIGANCHNTTSLGLVEAFNHFNSLAFLDLSRTLAVRDKTVLSRLKNLPLLQVLKLRNINLRDEDMVYLTNAIGCRVRSLDVSDNYLTDNSVRALLTLCFNTEEQDGPENGQHDRFPNVDVDDWPAGMIRPDYATLDEFKDESYDKGILQRLIGRNVSRLPFEDLPPSGITHLSISDNQISVEGLAALIRTKRLYMLDAGSLDMIKTITRPRSRSSSSPVRVDGHNLRLPGVQKLVPVLGRCAQEMTSLRIDHTVLTEIGPPDEEDLPLAVCELSVEDPTPELEAVVPQTVELDAAPPLYEMDTEQTPRYELPGDAVQFVLSPAVGDKPQLSPEEMTPAPRKGSVFAPEVLEMEEEAGGDEGEEEDVDSVVLTATGLGNLAQTANGVPSPASSPGPISRSDGSALNGGNVDLSISLIRRQRRELREKQTERPHGLMPGMLPKIRTITLTEVPAFESTRNSVDALIKFIRYCASETELATLEARLHSQSNLEPRSFGSKTPHKEKDDSREFFALQRIVLEMAQTDPVVTSPSHLSPHLLRKSKFHNFTRSSTEDADSEAFWHAAENDFTFFDDEEECGLPAAETSSPSPFSFYATSEKIMSTPTETSETDLETSAKAQQRKQRTKSEQPPPLIDVIQEVAKYRKERKLAFEEAAQRGVKFVDGYWPGELKVVRGHRLGVPSSEGMLDYYGNHFEKGWAYR